MKATEHSRKALENRATARSSRVLFDGIQYITDFRSVRPGARLRGHNITVFENRCRGFSNARQTHGRPYPCLALSARQPPATRDLLIGAERSSQHRRPCEVALDAFPWRAR